MSDILKLLNYMESGECKNIRALIRYACKNKMWSSLRRGGQLMRDAFNEVQSENNKKWYDDYCNKRDAQDNSQIEQQQNISGIPLGFTVDDSIDF